MNPTIEIYTDGSCHTQECIGAWAAILLVNEDQVHLSGNELSTTHNRMEILAVIKSIDYVLQHFTEYKNIQLVSDSQYVIGLVDRERKFILNDFKTKVGKDIRNKDLVIELLNLLKQIDIKFIKIKAHQKTSDAINYNSEVDKQCRAIVRDLVRDL